MRRTAKLVGGAAALVAFGNWRLRLILRRQGHVPCEAELREWREA